MSDNPDVLILTAQFGSGHLSVANALKQLIIDSGRDLKVDVKDFFKMTKPKGYQRLYKNYEYLVRHTSWLYNSYYYSKEKFEYLKILDTASFVIQSKLRRQLEQINPKIIISTFPACSGYISKYKEQYNVSTPLITVITDVVATNEWLYPHTDLYCVATKEIKDVLITKGIAEECIEVTGIPIRKSFYDKVDHYAFELLEKIPREKKVMTFLGGGLGLLPEEESFYEWLNQLEACHSIIITGKNKKLYDRLNKNLHFKNISVLGYTNKMDEIMKRSDLLIGKPGGITLFEAIITNVPCVILKPQLGQEIENCKYIQEKEIGFVVEDDEQLREVILNFLADEQILMGYKTRLESVRSYINSKRLMHYLTNWLEF